MRRFQLLDVILHRRTGHEWVRLFAQWGGEFESGHALLYSGYVRRDAWRIGPLGFGVMRMPRLESEADI